MQAPDLSICMMLTSKAVSAALPASGKAVSAQNQMLLQLFHGNSEILISNDTYQFNDYSKYEASKFNEPHKAKVKKEQFPVDCRNAFEMGVRLAAGCG